MTNLRRVRGYGQGPCPPESRAKTETENRKGKRKLPGSAQNVHKPRNGSSRKRKQRKESEENYQINNLENVL